MFTSNNVQEKHVKNILKFTHNMLKTTRPLLKDEEVKIVAEELVFRAGVKAASTHPGIFKFGDQTSQQKVPKKGRSTMLFKNCTDEEKIKTKDNLTNDKKRGYDAAELNESVNSNVFERLYSFRRKPSKKKVQIVQKIREEEKAMKAARGEPDFKRKKLCVSANKKNSLDLMQNLPKSDSNLKQYDGVPKRWTDEGPKRAKELNYKPMCIQSDYQNKLLIDKNNIEQEIMDMHKKLEHLSVRYLENATL